MTHFANALELAAQARNGHRVRFDRPIKPAKDSPICGPDGTPYPYGPIASDSVDPDLGNWSEWFCIPESGALFRALVYEVETSGNDRVLRPLDKDGDWWRPHPDATHWRCRFRWPRANQAGKPEFKTKQHGSVAVTTSSGQQWQRLDTCPRGSKVQLMFRFGLPRYEVYTGQPDALAWAPMPDSPEWLKDELSNQNRS